ncbi:hypothetical protein Tco_0173711 [Tanacetum coccineum]
MESFLLLHSHLKVLSINDLKRPGSKGGYEREFASLFDQDVQTFTSTMLLNLDLLEKQLDKEEFPEDRSMAAFWVIHKQFQMFIDSQFTWDYDSQMTEKYFAGYTGIEVKQFRETLLLHMGNVKKSVAERTRHKRHAIESENSNLEHAFNKSINESSGIESGKQDTSSNSGNYITHAVDADIRPANDQVPFIEFAKPSILGKSVLQPLRNQSVVRQLTAFRSERPKFSKPQFASQVDVNNILSKPVTPHYLPKVRESVFVKPNHVIASGSSRNSSKESYRLYTSSLLNAACKKALNLLKKGLLIRGEAVEASKRRRSLLDHKIQQLSKGSSEGSVHDGSNDEENKAENTKLMQKL